MHAIEVRDAPGYFVTKTGRVFSNKRETWLSPSSDRCGYMRVWVYKEGKRIELPIHRAVAKAWVHGDTSLTVNHIDGNKSNNNAVNLEWLSNADNMRHSWSLGLHHSHSGKRGTVTAFTADERSVMFSEIKSGKSIRSVALSHGVSPATLSYQYRKRNTI